MKGKNMKKKHTKFDGRIRYSSLQHAKYKIPSRASPAVGLSRPHRVLYTESHPRLCVSTCIFIAFVAFVAFASPLSFPTLPRPMPVPERVQERVAKNAGMSTHDQNEYSASSQT